ncbi:MAG TPA: spermidine synthase [Bacteroidales bacterium]|nr:spermidine synthase [Bacteroidales bacterium]
MKAEIFESKFWISETNAAVLKSETEILLLKSGFQIVGFTEHYFQPQGFTCVWLLAESHCAIHTFPEKNKSYILLNSCNSEYNKLFQNYFQHSFICL